MNTETLIKQVQNSTGDAKAEAIDALCQKVKELECEDGNPLGPVESALPLLADCLIEHDNGNVDGCAISIFRRVNISPETIERLLELNRMSRDELLIEAMGLCAAEDWTAKIESAVTDALEYENTVNSAAYALYKKVDSIRQAETLEKLASTAENCHGIAAGHAACTLVLLLQGDFGPMAFRILGRMINKNRNVDLLVNIAEALGWNKLPEYGTTLLKSLAEIPLQKVRDAVNRTRRRLGTY